MKNFIAGLVVGLMIFGGYAAREASRKPQEGVDPRSYLNEVIFKDANGKDFTRAQVLDFLLASALKRQPPPR